MLRFMRFVLLSFSIIKTKMNTIPSLALVFGYDRVKHVSFPPNFRRSVLGSETSCSKIASKERSCGRQANMIMQVGTCDLSYFMVPNAP